MNSRSSAVLLWLVLGACGGTSKSSTVQVPASGKISNSAAMSSASACWTGQTYSLDSGSCKGTPTACPADRVVRDDTCWLATDKYAVVVGDRVIRTEADDDDTASEKNQLGTVIATNTDDDESYVTVRWDATGSTGRYQRTDAGIDGIEVVVDGKPVALLQRMRVVPGPRCRTCADTAGTVLSVAAGVATIAWDNGRTGEHPSGIDGVLVSGGFDYPLAVGTRVVRGPAWIHGNDDRSGAGTVTKYVRGDTTAEVRWDSGRLRRYGWSSPEKSELAVVERQPAALSVGDRVGPGPLCRRCYYGDGVVKRVASADDVEVTWETGDVTTVPIGASGVLSIGPAPPPVARGVRVARGPDWIDGDHDLRGPGTVLDVLAGDRVTVRWDGGEERSYRWGADGVFEVSPSKEPLPPLSVGAKVRATPGCGSCKPGLGEVSKLVGKSRVIVTWPSGTAEVSVGAEGVLPGGVERLEMVVGALVRRGADWKWGDQDTEDGGNGTGRVTEIEVEGDESPGWVSVDWIGGGSNSYRFGAEGAYDLEIIGTAN